MSTAGIIIVVMAGIPVVPVSAVIHFVKDHTENTRPDIGHDSACPGDRAADGGPAFHYENDPVSERR